MNVTFCRISPKNFSYYYYGFTSYLFRKKNSLFLPQGWRFPKFSNKTDLLRFKCLTTPTNVCQSRIISIKAEIFKQNWYYCDLNAKRLQMSIKVELYLSKSNFRGTTTNEVIKNSKCLSQIFIKPQYSNKNWYHCDLSAKNSKYQS